MTNFGWKKNFLRLPEDILEKTSRMVSDEVVVSEVKRIPHQDILNGRYSHLGISLVDGVLQLPQSVLPDSSNGRYSKANVYGRTVILKDLPKIPRTYSWDAPDYRGGGYHDVSMVRQVYQRRYYFPKDYCIRIEIVDGGTSNAPQAVIKFTVGNVLDRSDPDFNMNLLYDLNLLQENTGVSNVFACDAPITAYLATLHVNWEILPPGTRDDVVAAIVRGISSRNPDVGVEIGRRYDVLNSLRPRNFISGTTGLNRYFGAQFGDNLVVFENLEYGNAIYVMFEQWQDISRLSRSELLRGGYNVIRIPHMPGWERRLSRVVEGHRTPEIDA